MPDWIVTAINTSALTGVCLFFMWASVAVGKYVAEKVTALVQGILAFLVSVSSNSTKTNECLDRLCAMGDNTVKGIGDLHHKQDTLQRSFDGLNHEFREVKETVGEHSAMLQGRKEASV